MPEAFSNVGLLKFLLGLPELKDMGTVALLDISKDANAEFLKQGEALSADSHTDRNLYLVEGELELVADDKIMQVIKAGSERAKEPLFRVHTHTLQALALKPSSLLSLSEAKIEKYLADVKPQEEEITINPVNTLNDDEVIIDEIKQEFNQQQVDLPSMPEVAVKINQAVQDESLDFQSIADVVQNDPMVSARAVQVANSAMYAGSQPVQTIKKAIQRIGLRAMRAIVMSVVLRNLYSPVSPLIKKRMKRYYQHSVRVGVISHVLARRLKGFDPEQAFLAGLIHDIGTMAILIRADQHEELKDNSDLLEKIIADLSDKVGSMLLQQWGFEKELITASLEAEDWDRDVIRPDYCDIVQVAQLHCKMIGGAELDAPPLSELPALHRLDLGEVNPMLIVAQAKQEMAEVIHLLE